MIALAEVDQILQIYVDTAKIIDEAVQDSKKGVIQIFIENLKFRPQW